MVSLSDEIVSDQALQQAFEWLCERRRKYSHNSDVWDVRWRWNQLKPAVQRDLQAGGFRFSPLRRYRIDGEVRDIWTALDALVLKAITIVLTRILQSRLSSRCFHLAGNGGAKAAVREVIRNRSRHRFVMRSDVRSYYASIDHDVLFGLLKRHISDSRLLDLLWQYMRRSIYEDGRYHDVTRGISLGCPLSPLMAALYLTELDQAMEETGLFYVRYMDDWIVMAPTRWKLRHAVRIVNQVLHRLKVEQHPDKTFIGHVASGFDFLGYQITDQQFTVSARTKQRFVERVSRLYEQGAERTRIGDYVRHWQRWVMSGLGNALDGADTLTLNASCHLA
jgi:RNA-directed DNA polymerase